MLNENHHRFEAVRDVQTLNEHRDFYLLPVDKEDELIGGGPRLAVAHGNLHAVSRLCHLSVIQQKWSGASLLGGWILHREVCLTGPSPTVPQPHWGQIWCCVQVLWHHHKVPHMQPPPQSWLINSLSPINPVWSWSLFLFVRVKGANDPVHLWVVLRGLTFSSRHDLWPQISSGPAAIFRLIIHSQAPTCRSKVTLHALTGSVTRSSDSSVSFCSHWWRLALITSSFTEKNLRETRIISAHEQQSHKDSKQWGKNKIYPVLLKNHDASIAAF